VSSKHYCPNSTSSQNYQTLTLAINGNNGAPNQDCSRPTTPYTQPTNSRRTVKTNEAAINIKNNDNDFSNSLANATKALQQSTSTSDYNSIRVQNSEIIPTTPACVRTVHLNSSSPASDYYIKVNGNRQCIQVNQSYLKQDAGSPVGGNKNEFQGSCTNSNKVVLKLGDITSDQIQRTCNPTQSKWRYNKTWNENMKGKYRQSIQTAGIFKHDYENVYDDLSRPISDARSDKKDNNNSRQTPRSRKKSKHPGQGSVYRSKSCERVAGVIDRLSEKLSISGVGGPLGDTPSPAPPTPTPSLLHSVAARAIPCVDIKPGCVSGGGGGRISPTESLAYQGIETGPFRPSQSLADRMRGRLEYVNKKMKIIRSRSAERLRGYVRPEVQHCEVTGGHGEVHERSSRSQHRSRAISRVSDYSDYSGPVLGQARALVSCIPSPYDTDVLAFQAGDIIDVLQMNQNGLWRGRCRERIGQFKFINVELLPTRRRKRSSSRSLRKMRATQSRPPVNITEVMRMLDMAEYLPVFVLNGYEDLSLFKDLDDDELDYLGITNLKQRQKVIDMANLLFPDEKNIDEDEAETSDDDSDSNIDSSSESGIADINSDEAYSSYNSAKHN